MDKLEKNTRFTFIKGNIADKNLVSECFEKYKPDIVVNLTAQAGVRYSITHPDAYIESNLLVFIIFWKHAVIVMIMVQQECNILFMPPPHQYMVQIKRFHTLRMIK